MTSPFQVLPSLSPDDFDRLKSSIAARGVEVPVIVDENGDVIDGHNRAMIADSLGIEYPKETRAGLAPHEKRLLAVDLNLARRHLTDAQKVLIGRQIEPDIAERARLRQVELAGTRRETSVTDVAKVEASNRTTDEVAKTVGLGSGRTYERGKQTIARAEKALGPEKVKAAVAGGTTIRELNETAKRSEKAVESAVAGKPTSLRKALRQKADAEMLAFVESLDDEVVKEWNEGTRQLIMQPRICEVLCEAILHLLEASNAIKQVPREEIRKRRDDPKVAELLSAFAGYASDLTAFVGEVADDSEGPRLRRVQ